MKAAGLGIFMVSAAVFTTLFEYPHSAVYAAIPDPLVRRVCIGIAMGLTAIGIIYSPWGKQSGAHLNPAVTLTFFRLGKIEGVDATFYVLAQSLGGLIGVLMSAAAIMGDPPRLETPSQLATPAARSAPCEQASAVWQEVNCAALAALLLVLDVLSSSSPLGHKPCMARCSQFLNWSPMELFFWFSEEYRA